MELEKLHLYFRFRLFFSKLQKNPRFRFLKAEGSLTSCPAAEILQQGAFVICRSVR